MFGFIKKLFGGIFAFLGGLIGGKKAKEGDTSSTPAIAPQGKKSKGYYLELDETGNTKSKLEEALKPEAIKAEAVKALEPVQAAVTTAAKKLEAAAPKKQEPAQASAESAAQNGKVKIEAQPNPPAATNGKASEKVTFAPNYLLPTASNNRRRPGPSMDMFRDMARQVKTPG